MVRMKGEPTSSAALMCEACPRTDSAGRGSKCFNLTYWKRLENPMRCTAPANATRANLCSFQKGCGAPDQAVWDSPSLLNRRKKEQDVCPGRGREFRGNCLHSPPGRGFTTLRAKAYPMRTSRCRTSIGSRPHSDVTTSPIGAHESEARLPEPTQTWARGLTRRGPASPSAAIPM